MFSFTNINDIRSLAIEYQTTGKYPYAEEYEDLYQELNANRKKNDPEIMPIIEQMSYGAQEFAKYWIRRFTNGDTIGGVYYTGEHLFYLNVCAIEKVILNEQAIFKNKSKHERKIGSRGTGFPDFWDEDYKYFTTCYLARHGTKRLFDAEGQPLETRLEAYNRIYGNLGIDLGLELDEANLSGGLNHLYVKPRGVGFSWKLGNWNNHSLYLAGDTHNFIFADNKEYLGAKDGIMAKFSKIRNFIQDKVWFLRKNFFTENMSNYNFSTGQKVIRGGSEFIVGFNSSVSGIIVDGDSDKGRGKRGNCSFEEFGSFPKVGETWQKADPSVNEYGTIFGQIRGGGTGGGTGEGYEDLERMYYDPKSYRIIRFKNPYEDAYRGDGCGMFTPAYINISYKDEFGNSIIEESKEETDREREEKKKSSDPTVFTNHCAEKPYQPNEAFNATGINILPVQLAKDQLAYLVQSDWDRTVCKYGDFIQTPTGFEFKILPGVLPYEGFPVKAAHDKESCVVIYQQPHKENGKVPENLYTISLDPYSEEDAADSSSIGSWVVTENKNNITRSRGGIEVCWYDGRSEGADGQDRFYRRLYYAAEYYNAKVVIENNEKGKSVHYARTHTDTKGQQLTKYLEGQLALGYDPNIATKKSMTREYGVHITKERKAQGLKDYQEDLLYERGMRTDSEGVETKILNINFCYNRGLLKEIISYNGKNADRISARIVKVFAAQDFEDKKKKVGKTVNRDKFFDIPLFR